MGDPLSRVFLKEKEFGCEVASTQKKIKQDLVTVSQEQIRVVGTLKFLSDWFRQGPSF